MVGGLGGAGDTAGRQQSSSMLPLTSVDAMCFTVTVSEGHPRRPDLARVDRDPETKPNKGRGPNCGKQP
ncbi:hypothetical protein ACRRTK_000639 [Alexandromys fortis]